MNIKKGDIGVRTNTSWGIGNKEVGRLYEAVGVSNFDAERFLYALGTSMRPENFRLATEEEIEAFNLGCRHIDDLDQYINREQLLTQIL